MRGLTKEIGGVRSFAFYEGIKDYYMSKQRIRKRVSFKNLIALTLFSLTAFGFSTVAEAASTSDTLKEAALNGIYLGSDYCDLDGGNRDVARCYYLGYDKGDGKYKIIVSQIWNNDGLLNNGHGDKLISPSVGINNSNSLSASQVLTKDQMKLFGFGGGSVLDNLADGKYTQKEKITDSSGNETYKVNVIANGQISQNNTGLVTGNTVYNAIQDVKSNIKTYKAGQDITISDAYSISVKKNGLIEKGNQGIVTGETVFNVTNKLSNTLNTQKTQLSSATKRIGTLASTVSDLKDTIIDINTSVTTAIASSSATINGRLDTNMSNLTEDGRDTLRQYIRDEIKNVAAENMHKTGASTQNMSNEAVMPNGDTLADKADKADLDNLSKVVDSKANTSDVNAALDKKADKDNVYTKTEVDNKFTSVSNELDNKVDKSDFNTVKDQVDKNTTDIAKKADLAYVDSALSTKADKSEVNALEKKVDTKADKTALDALSKTVDQKADLAYVDNELSKKANLADFNQLKDTVSANTDKITANSEKITTNTKDIEGLKETKADADGSNIDVSKFTEKLGVGKIEKDNAGLVTGGVVADALAYKADYGYVNAGFNALEGQMQQMNQNLTKNINQVGAGAAALAGLHPQEYDPNCKLDFAAGYGHYKNTNATALGMYYRPNAGTTISLAGTIGNGAPMLSAGLSFKIGYGKNVEKVMVTKDAFEAQQKENQEMKKQIQEQNQKIQEMEATLKQLMAK